MAYIFFCYIFLFSFVVVEERKQPTSSVKVPDCYPVTSIKLEADELSVLQKRCGEYELKKFKNIKFKQLKKVDMIQ